MKHRKTRWFAALLALVLALSLLPVSAFAAEAAPLPEKFDLRHADLDGDGVYRNYVTPVKFQNPFGTCWAFGGIAAAETSILSDRRMSYEESGGLDFSEKHLAWFATHAVTKEEYPDQADEGLRLFDEEENPNGFYNDGGKAIYITTLFSSGVGPVKEDGFPYRGKNGLTVYGELKTEKGKADYMENTWDDIIKDYEKDVGHEYTSYEELREWLNDKWKVYETKEALLEALYQSALENRKTNNEYSSHDDWTIPTVDDGSYNRNLYNGYTLRDGNILPALARYDGNDEYLGVSEEAMQAMKEELMAGRGVILSYYADQSRPNEHNQSKYMDMNNWAHYTYEAVGTNHTVCVVGWDDTYPKENFVHAPPDNGAWIVKNSWGSELNWETVDGTTIGKQAWGVEDEEGRHTGYFYLSYYDQSLYKAPETLRFSNDMEGYRFFASQYDLMPAYSGFSTGRSGETLATANVFTAQDDQWLTSVSTRTSDNGADVTFRVYLLDNDCEDPMDGIGAAEFSEHFQWKGYHRVDLETPVALREGQRYAVIATESYVYPDEKEEEQILYRFSANLGTGWDLSIKEKDTLYCTAKVNPGESWLFADGQWQDWASSRYRLADVEKGYVVDNFSIKAFGIPIEAHWFSDDGVLTVSKLPAGVRAVAALYNEKEQLMQTHIFTEGGEWISDTDAAPAKVKVFYINDAWQPLREAEDLPLGS